MKRSSINLVSSPQTFNLVQSRLEDILVINMLKENPFRGVNVPTIDLHEQIDKLLSSNPIAFKTNKDFEKFIHEDEGKFLHKISDCINDENLKMRFSKRKR